MAKVKVFFDAESQTGQKLDAPEFHSGGIKTLLYWFSLAHLDDMIHYAKHR